MGHKSGFDIRELELLAGRGDEHFETLNKELKVFYENNPQPFSIHSQDDLQNQRHIIRIQMPLAPKRLAVIALDGLNCLRASLDHLAWQLSLLTTKAPYARTEFPVSGELSPDSKRHFKRVTQDIPAIAIAIIESLQPHHRGQAFKDHPLWQLNKLCNIGKHRLIPMHSSYFHIQIPKGIPYSIKMLDDGAIVEMPLADKPKMKEAPICTFGVAFGDSSEGTPIIHVDRLGPIYNFVRNDAIPRFASFFPQTPNP